MNENDFKNEVILDISDQVGVQVSVQVKAHDEAHDEAHDLTKKDLHILKSCFNTAQSTSEIVKELELYPRYWYIKKSLSKLLELKYLDFTLPDKPKSENPKYKITEKGKRFIKNGN